jgi:hypothetical protein
MAFFTAGCGNASTDSGSSGVGGDSQTSAGDPPHGFGSLPPVGGGGALFAKDCDVVIVGSNFSGNSARSYGGAALLSFSGNRSGSRFAGGSGPSSHARVLQVDGNAMMGNHAALLGGAVLWRFGTVRTRMISDSAETRFWTAPAPTVQALEGSV